MGKNLALQITKDVFVNDWWFLFPYLLSYLLLFTPLDHVFFEGRISNFLTHLNIYGPFGTVFMVIFTLSIVGIGRWINRKKIVENFVEDIGKIYIYSFLHVMIETNAVLFAIGVGLLSLFKNVIEVQNGIPYQFGWLDLAVIVYPFVSSLIARWYTRESITAMLIYDAINQALLKAIGRFRQNGVKE